MRHETQRSKHQQSFMTFLDSWGVVYSKNVNSENTYSHEGSGSGICAISVSGEIDLSEILDEFGRENITWKSITMDSGYNTATWEANRVIFV